MSEALSDTDDGLEDAAIVAQVLAGDVDRYAVLVRRHHGKLAASLARHCRSAAEVEEVVQDAFVRAYGNLGGYDRSRPFFPWLRAVARNELLKRIERSQSQRIRLERYWRERQRQIAAEDDEAETVDDARLDALRRCLAQLPEQQRELLTARYRQGRRVEDLARDDGRSLSAMKSLLLRLRRALRDCVESRIGARA